MSVLMKIHLLLLMLLVIGNNHLVADDAPIPLNADMRTRFSIAYANWANALKSPELQEDSGALLYTHPAFLAIVDLGPPALPFLFEQMQDVSDKRAFHLTAASHYILKSGLSPAAEKRIHSRSERIREWTTWWANARTEVKGSFVETRRTYELAKQAGNLIAMEQARKELRALGVLALPYLFQAIDEGNFELIPLASELTNSKFPRDATREVAQDWWRANQSKWVVNP
jgi:hypothetical protein